jgi:hypothetical protein
MAARRRLLVRGTRNEKEPMATARMRRRGLVAVVAVLRCGTLSIQMGTAHVGTEGQQASGSRACVTASRQVARISV